MEERKNQIKTIDEYINQYPTHIQGYLQSVRQAIKEVACEAIEKISYQMPTFYLHGNLVRFAAYTHHIGFYPSPSGIEKFHQELSNYKNAKGSVQFPYDFAIPLELIQEIVQFRVQENLRLVEEKRIKNKLKNQTIKLEG
jgi:uncharacterized protein YdhG (YjbR/CyaY superfamily)